MDKMLGGYQALQIRLLNGRIFQKLLSKEPEAQYCVNNIEYIISTYCKT